MKKILFAFLAAAMAFSFGSKADAQEVAVDSCRKYVSFYVEYYKQKNYTDATPNWRKAYKYCAHNYNQRVYSDGAVIVRRVIAANKNNAGYVKALVDTLLNLYDIRVANFPAYTVQALNNKGSDIINYVKDPAQVFEGLEGVIEVNKEKTKPSLLFNNLNTAITLYQDGKLDAEKVIATYERNIAIVASIEPGKDASQDVLDKAKGDMESIFITSKVASCENLIALFTPRYDADPDNIELATNIVKMMTKTEDCINNDLFLRATTAMHKNEPSAQSAYALHLLNARQGNDAASGSFLEEAVRLATEAGDADAADYTLQYATYCLKNGQKSKAFSYAQKAAELNPEFAGKAYYIIGTIWGSTTCDGDDIARRSPYWVAVDFLQKAREADPSLADDCNRLIAQYRVFYPQTAEAFMYDLTDGMSYTVACGGMRAVTTVRTQK